MEALNPDDEAVKKALEFIEGPHSELSAAAIRERRYSAIVAAAYRRQQEESQANYIKAERDYAARVKAEAESSRLRTDVECYSRDAAKYSTELARAKNEIHALQSKLDEAKLIKFLDDGAKTDLETGALEWRKQALDKDAENRELRERVESLTRKMREASDAMRAAQGLVKAQPWYQQVRAIISSALSPTPPAAEQGKECDTMKKKPMDKEIKWTS